MSVQFISFSCSFQQKVCKKLVSAPTFWGWRPIWEILDPPLMVPPDRSNIAILHHQFPLQMDLCSRNRRGYRDMAILHHQFPLQMDSCSRNRRGHRCRRWQPVPSQNTEHPVCEPDHPVTKGWKPSWIHGIRKVKPCSHITNFSPI